MITLTSGNVTKVIALDKNKLRYFQVASDNINIITRLGNTADSVSLFTGGFGITAYAPAVVAVKPGEEIFAVATSGQVNISVAEAYNPVSAIRLY